MEVVGKLDAYEKSGLGRGQFIRRLMASKDVKVGRVKPEVPPSPSAAIGVAPPALGEVPPSTPLEKDGPWRWPVPSKGLLRSFVWLQSRATLSHKS